MTGVFQDIEFGGRFPELARIIRVVSVATPFGRRLPSTERNYATLAIGKRTGGLSGNYISPLLPPVRCAFCSSPLCQFGRTRGYGPDWFC